MRLLNTTGTCYRDNKGFLFSYDTQLDFIYKGHYLENMTFYSMTTRKHQRNLERVHWFCQLTQCPVGAREAYITDYILKEIKYLKHDITQRICKRMTTKNKQCIDRSACKIEFLEALLAL